jgi:hypothetical protein
VLVAVVAGVVVLVAGVVAMPRGAGGAGRLVSTTALGSSSGEVGAPAAGAAVHSRTPAARASDSLRERRHGRGASTGAASPTTVTRC